MEIEFDPLALFGALCFVMVVIAGFLGPVGYGWILGHYWQQLLIFLGGWLLAMAAFVKIIDWGTD
ncbi:MAG: hypothetical protein ACYCY2_05440 [Acidithiobacillus ferriphilus]